MSVQTEPDGAPAMADGAELASLSRSTVTPPILDEATKATTTASYSGEEESTKTVTTSTTTMNAIRNNDEEPSEQQQGEHHEQQHYYALILDSGPIIKRSITTEHSSSLLDMAIRGDMKIYTVPGVVSEIRDGKARDYYESLPFDVTVKEPSLEGCKAVIDFAKKTGDYRSLSGVDVQVLALVYDLEKEGCKGITSHIRTEPKRTLGVGRIERLDRSHGGCGSSVASSITATTATKSAGGAEPDGTSFFEIDHDDSDDDTSDSDDEKDKERKHGGKDELQPTADVSADTSPSDSKPISVGEKKPMTWAMLVNGNSTSSTTSANVPPTTASSNGTSVHPDRKIAGVALEAKFGSINLTPNTNTKVPNKEIKVLGGQFDDAEEEENNDDMIREELISDFPSLAAAMTVPYEGSDDECEGDNKEEEKKKKESLLKEQERKMAESLKPLAKNGKLYNSFRKYKNLVKPQGVEIRRNNGRDHSNHKGDVESKVDDAPSIFSAAPVAENKPNLSTKDGERVQSRIVGFTGASLQADDDVEDDGEGWVTSVRDIQAMKASGSLDPVRSSNDQWNRRPNKEDLTGPPMCQRAACATIDFAMQNVLLQMNLMLVTVDGMKVRKLKSWVARCGACFAVYTAVDSTGGMNRMFCARCGSGDSMQRVAASVDGKTGRLRLHLSKKYKNNLRGTKYSLPKPGKGNRFQGDLLLREDQLMMGAWNQKVKKRSGSHTAQSMFGSDIADNVGCHADLTKRDDIKYGFGRRNPNATKFGRERRGKKKKSSDKACGLRRY